MSQQMFFAPLALLPNGWQENVLIEVSQGHITRVAEGQCRPADASLLSGPTLPTMANLHSHAFQRIMAGLSEVSLNPNDNFWSWRDTMYKLVARLTPDDAEIIATELYIDMLKAGYGQVVEFNYLHHTPEGKPYSDPAEMNRRLLQAAKSAGLGITLAPVLYSYGGFGEQPCNPAQQRFRHSTDDYLQLLNTLSGQLTSAPSTQSLAVCFHSIRAVTAEQISQVLSAQQAKLPVHIHIAEQQKEVRDCLEHYGQRPVEWLFSNAEVSPEWCLIHATHLNPSEISLLARSRAVAGLCPTTEANLGDGIFPAQSFLAEQGRIGIGSDSHVGLSVAEELRLLEYGQRLQAQQRNRLYTADQPAVGDYLFNACLEGGAQAAGITSGIRPGARADFMTLNSELAEIAGAQPAQLLNRWIFACRENPVKDVYIAGQQRIFAGQHPQQKNSRENYIALQHRLQL